MIDDLLLQTLARIEAKVDKLADEVAEIRGTRKTIYAIATLGGSLGGLLAAKLLGRL